MNVLQSNIQDAIRLSGNATFGNSYKSEKLAPDNANQKCQDLLMILKEEMKGCCLIFTYAGEWRSVHSFGNWSFH
jgi:hypothetical protein